MKSVDVVIVDDEKSARSLLKSLLNEENWIHIAGESDNVDDAIQVILSTHPDVVLLDVQMPFKDGFSLIEQLQESKHQVEIIFVTAYEQYAIKAIKASAFDYLLKPVKKKELIESLKKLSDRINVEHLEQKFSKLMQHLNHRKKIKLKSASGYLFLDPDDIMFFQTASEGTNIICKSGKKEILPVSLTSVEEILNNHTFCRLSRSVIVNINYIKQLDRKSMTCILDKVFTEPLKISRKYLNQLETCCDQLIDSYKNSESWKNQEN